MTIDAMDSGRFDLGRVMQQAFGVLGRNAVTLLALALILAVVPAAVAGYFQVGMVKDVMSGFRGGDVNFSPVTVTGSLMGVVASVVAGAILQGAMIYVTVQDMNGQRASVGDALTVGFRNFLPLIGVSILFGIAFVIGCILLFVPGVMIACAWCVAAPALIADRTGVFGSFSRSSDLTRGNRWQIFGLIVIMSIALGIIGAILNAIAGVPVMRAPGGDPIAAMDAALSPFPLAMSVLRAVLGEVVGAVGAAVVYVEVRRAREGGAPQWLADIFS